MADIIFLQNTKMKQSNDKCKILNDALKKVLAFRTPGLELEVSMYKTEIFVILTRMTKTIDKICFFGRSVIHPHHDVPLRFFALIHTGFEGRRGCKKVTTISTEGWC